MRRATLTTVGAGVVFAALVAYLWWIDQPAQGPAAVSPAIWSLDPARVEQLTIARRLQPTIVVRRRDDGWQLEAPARYPTSSAAVEETVSRLASLSARRAVVASASDMAAYGLADPAATVTLRFKDGRVQRLLIGDRSPLTQGEPSYYARDEASPTIFTVSGELAETLLGPVDALRDRRLVGIGADAVRAVRVDKEGRVVVSAVAEEGDHVPPERRWRLVEPVQAPADYETVHGILLDLEFARAQRFVSDAPSETQLKAWGLLAPAFHVRLTSAQGQEVGLQLGRRGSDGMWYTRIDGQPYVLAVREEELQGILEVEVARWLQRRVIGMARDEVRRVEFQLDGPEGSVHAVARRDEPKAATTWWLDGDRRLDDAQVNELLDALWGLRAERARLLTGSRGSDAAGRSPGRAVWRLTVEGRQAGPGAAPAPVTRITGQDGGGQVVAEQGPVAFGYDGVSTRAIEELKQLLHRWVTTGAGSSDSSGSGGS